MDNSLKSSKGCARILEVIGYLLIPICFIITLLALSILLFEWNWSQAILGAILWLFGLYLYIFYVRHSRMNNLTNKVIHFNWILSLIYNVIGFISFICISFLFDFNLFIGFWGIIVGLHVLFSIRGLKNILQDIQLVHLVRTQK